MGLPVMPFTLSCGYKFGFPLGVGVALAAMGLSATISFLLARTALRPVVERVFAGSKLFNLMNRAVQREGFKIILLSRFSPVMPFAPANFAYGLSSASYVVFITASLCGLFPATALTIYLATTAGSQGWSFNEGPWYVYAATLGVTLFTVKLVSDAARRTLNEAVAQGEPSTEPP